MTTQFTPDQTALTEVLRKIASTEAVARALGIKDIASQDEEFWTAQRRAARQRFYLMCLNNLKWDLAFRVEELDELECRIVSDQAEAYLDEQNMDYTRIRQWFLNYGQYAYNTALARRKEREHVESMCLRVLVVLEKGASYLAYNDDDTPILVSKPEMAHQFPVNHASELEPDYRAKMALHFTAIQTLFNGTGVKLLASSRNK